MVRRTGARVKKLAIVVVVVLAGCHQAGIGPKTAGGAPTPREAVDRFIGAAKAQDYDGMSLVFGDKRGPARATTPKAELEKRLFVMMRCLRNDRIQIGAESPTPLGERYIPVQFTLRDLTASSNFVVM